MTDKELLELAAKAAGIELYFENIGTKLEVTNRETLKLWNPLTDDGDALRLAVKLHLRITGYFANCGIVNDWMLEMEDPYAATRRAIVRAAAEIGSKS
jgi:hypothetical protein